MTSPLPLDGIRILDLSWSLAGPYATMALGDFGAEIIKIEAPANYDQARGPVDRYDWRPYPEDRSMGRAFNQSSLFNKPNRNKLGITLDLSQQEGRDAFSRLVRVSDVVIENFSARVLTKLGINYERLREIKPDIILVSMPAFGLEGPERDYIAYGSSLEMIAGLVSLRGYGDGMPVRSALNYGDPNAGLHAVGAVMTALMHREKTGEGQHVEIAQMEILISMIGEFVLDYTMNGRIDEPTGNHHPSMAPHNVYQCAGDDRWLAIAVGSDEEWRTLCTIMERPDLAEDPRFATVLGRKVNEDALDAEISAWTADKDAQTLFRALADAGIAAGPALANEQLFEDPQLAHRGFFVPITHPATGTHLYPGTPADFSRTPYQIRMPAPLFGQHNREVLRDIAGLTDAEIDDLAAKKVIVTEPTADVWAQH